MRELNSISLCSVYQSIRKNRKIGLAPSIQNCKHNLFKQSIPFRFLENLLIDPGNLSWGVLECTATHRPEHTMRDLVLCKNSEDLSHFVFENFNILRSS